MRNVADKRHGICLRYILHFRTSKIVLFDRILIILVTLPEVIISQKILKSCSEIPFFFFFYLREYRGQPEMSKILSQPSENWKNKQTYLEENILSHRLRSHLELG